MYTFTNNGWHAKILFTNGKVRILRKQELLSIAGIGVRVNTLNKRGILVKCEDIPIHLIHMIEWV
jgi:hypothetical protein